VYFTVNSTIYNNNEKKVVTALIYITEGNTAAWATTFYENVDQKTSKSFGTFTNFEKDFQAMFIPIGVSIVALNKIAELKQKGDLTSHITKFCSLIAVANVKESHILIHV
jgi:hypothetical protein